MPTGYTQDIYEGNPITFEQFVLKCSRAMGAAIMQRDESPDAEIRMREVPDYEIERVKKARAELEAALARTDDEWAAMRDAEIAEASAYQVKYVADRTELAKRYREMQKHVREWTPPTVEHEGLKEFMLDQLGESYNFDVGHPNRKPYTPEIPDEVPVYMYKARQIAKLSKHQADATLRLADEYERVRSQNEWVRALRDSLITGGDS